MRDKRQVNTNLAEYYSRRAREYDAIYHRDDPVRQQEQSAIASAMRSALAGRRVLEVACGTGYWTQIATEVAQHAVATDASPEMLAIARRKALPPGKVEFTAADAFDLASVAGTFDAALANFWLSHVPRTRLDEFLDRLHARIGGEAIVFMADNMYVLGVGGNLVVRSGTDDTFKLRTLADGSEYEVIKNYYDAASLRNLLEPRGRALSIQLGRCFWWVSYRTR